MRGHREGFACNEFNTSICTALKVTSGNTGKSSPRVPVRLPGAQCQQQAGLSLLGLEPQHPERLQL